MASSISLTDKDVQLLSAYIKHCSAAVDWNKVINDTPDFKTAKYARDRFALLRKRIVGDAGEDTANGTKKAGDKRKQEAEDDEEAPKKKPKARGKNEKKTAETTPETDGDDEEPGDGVKAEASGGDEWD